MLDQSVAGDRHERVGAGRKDSEIGGRVEGGTGEEEAEEKRDETVEDRGRRRYCDGCEQEWQWQWK